MSYKEMCKMINKLVRGKVETLNRSDVKDYYGLEISERTATMLEMCGCEVVFVADLFNVTLPKKTITKQKQMMLALFD